MLFPMLTLGIIWLPNRAGAQATPQIVESWSNVFGGHEVVYHLRAPDGTAVAWRLSAGNATVQRGEATLSSGVAELRLRIPDVKEGVVFPLTLTVGGSVIRTLYAFPEDPFVDRRHWLKALNVQLFDPEGPTRELFDALELPYTDWANLDGLADQQGGLVVIGEGVSFDAYPALMEVMAGLAERLPVLCLAPESGAFDLPVTPEAGLPVPEAIRLEKRSVVRTLDKRLDAVGWAPDGRLPLRGIRIESGRRGTVGVVEEDEAGWAWVDLRYRGHRSRLVICGIELIEAWPTGPTPRFLLARILEELNPKQEESP